MVDILLYLFCTTGSVLRNYSTWIHSSRLFHRTASRRSGVHGAGAADAGYYAMVRKNVYFAYNHDVEWATPWFPL